jgi:hypothetical protein
LLPHIDEKAQENKNCTHESKWSNWFVHDEVREHKTKNGTQKKPIRTAVAKIAQKKNPALYARDRNYENQPECCAPKTKIKFVLIAVPGQ